MWSKEYRIDTPASPETLWALFEKVNDWGRWNAGIEHIKLDGPFATGSTFFMKPPGMDGFVSRLSQVDALRGFTDITELDGLTITVNHLITRVSEQLTQVSYAIQVQGDNAREVGEAISGDFPDVLRALVELAEQG